MGDVVEFTGDWDGDIDPSEMLGYLVEKYKGQTAVDMIVLVRTDDGITAHMTENHGRGETVLALEMAKMSLLLPGMEG